MFDDLSGIEVTQQVKEKNDHVAIVILSMYDDRSHIVEALKAGADAYVIKKSVTEDLITAIKSVAVGRRYLGSSLTDIVVDAFIEKLENEPIDAYDLLSKREREVINLVAHGHTNTEIADRLFLSRRTVETHRANAMRKLNLENQTDLLRFALSKGLISSDTN